jgi:hypothetical protein
MKMAGNHIFSPKNFTNMKSKILRTYVRLKKGQLYVKASHIVSSIRKHVAYFAQPDPSLEYAEQLLQEYLESLKAAESRDKSAVANKTGKYNLVIEFLDLLALYVAQQAKGNREILSASGFDISIESINRKTGTMSIITGTAPGQVEVSAQAVRGARSYMHEFTTDPLIESNVWTQVTTTSRKHVHTGLVPGQKYWFRVVAVGLRGQYTWSEPVARIVQ